MTDERLRNDDSAKLPLVSVVMFCRNGAKTIVRSIESVLNQSYSNIEYIVQDGASTDGTKEVLESYGSKINLVSVPDGGTNDGFWRALQRCNGEFIAVCLADEALMPCAVERAVQEFRADPRIGAVTGDAYLWNDDGTIFGRHVGQEFDLLAYLFGDYCPNFSASIFRRSALEQVGFFAERWKPEKMESIEFEIWCRLGTDHCVKYVSYIFSKYGINDNQMGHNLPRIEGELDARCAIIDNCLFGEEGFFGKNLELRNFIVTRQFEIIMNHLQAYRREEDSQTIRNKMNGWFERHRSSLSTNQSAPRENQSSPPDLVRSKTSAEVECHQRPVQITWRAKALDALVRIVPQWHANDVHRSTSQTLDFLTSIIPRFVRNRIPRGYKLALLAALHRRYYQPPKMNIGSGVTALVSNDGTAAANTAPSEISPDITLLRAKFYRVVADIFGERALVDEARRMLLKAAALNDPYVASEACIYMLKSPSATESDLSEFMQKWSDRYTIPKLEKVAYRFPSRGAKEKLTIAYHCIFWDSITGNAQALTTIAKHDRSKFRVIGYSPSEESKKITGVFDAFEKTGHLDDTGFIDRLRKENVDVFVELSGLSIYHRFSAMASRCAPVQVAALNHTSTTRVPNVDFILADDIAARKENDIHFSEEVYRLPSCFFCFDYDEETLPKVASPPCLKNGYVTFGFFGKSDKINYFNIELWAAVLHEVPRSKLLIQNHGMSSNAVRQFFFRQFHSNGIGRDRLIFLAGGDRNDVLRNYSRVDISLDSWPYCGGNTIAESVNQGVPVITLRGARFASAYGASLITACGLPELVAKTPEEYVSITAHLATDSEKLQHLRINLRKMARQYGLGDSGRFARVLEDAFEQMAVEKGVRHADAYH